MLYQQLTHSIKETHIALQRYAVKAINMGLTARNLLIGYYIVEYEQKGEDRAEYGKRLLENISRSLKDEGLSNISAAELSRFRQFYNVYPQILGTLSQELSLPARILGTASQEFRKPTDQADIAHVQLLIANLSFSHFAELIKIDDPVKRAFYEVETIKGTWGVRELRRQISSLYCERTGLSKDPQKLMEMTQEKADTIQVDDIIKSPFTFEFLGLKAHEVITESDIERAIMDNIQHFLLELGNGFCFEARQKKILIEDEYFFVDLVFYHRILNCHVLIEIKADEFKHEHIGQLNVYLEHYKRKVMSINDNPPVGILLITNKNNTLVEYAKGTLDNKLFVSKYLLELPEKESLKLIIESERQKLEALK